MSSTVAIDQMFFKSMAARIKARRHDAIQARDHVNLGGVVSVAFLVVVHGLELVLLLLVQVAHFCEDLGVGGDLSDEDVVPF